MYLPTSNIDIDVPTTSGEILRSASDTLLVN